MLQLSIYSLALVERLRERGRKGPGWPMGRKSRGLAQFPGGFSWLLPRFGSSQRAVIPARELAPAQHGQGRPRWTCRRETPAKCFPELSGRQLLPKPRICIISAPAWGKKQLAPIAGALIPAPSLVSFRQPTARNRLAFLYSRPHRSLRAEQDISEMAPLENPLSKPAAATKGT